jgi:hypothetical protein
MAWNMPDGCSENDIPGWNEPDRSDEFDAWMIEVAAHIHKLTNGKADVNVFPAAAFDVWFNEDMTPAKAAERAINEAAIDYEEDV